MWSNTLVQAFWKSNRTQLLLMLLAGWLASICTFLLTVSLGAFFTLHYQSATNRDKILEILGIRPGNLTQFFIFFFAVVAAKALLQYLEKDRMAQMAEQYINQLTRSLFSTQMRWSGETFHEKPYGRYLLRYSGDLNSIRNLIVRGIHGSLRDILFLLTGTGLLFLLSIPLTVVVLVAVVLYIPILYGLNRYQKPFIRRKRNRKSLLLAYVAGSFSRYDTIRQQQQETETIRAFDRKLRRLFRASRSYEHAESLRQVAAPLLSQLLTGFLLLQLATSHWHITAGELLVYLLVLAAIVPSLRRLFKVPGVIHRGMLSLDKIAMLLHKEGHKTLPATPPDVAGVHSTVAGTRKDKRRMLISPTTPSTSSDIPARI